MSGDKVTRVCIETPPLSVTVEAPGVSLTVVRQQAVAIYREIYEAGMRHSPITAGGMGFVATAAAVHNDDPEEKS